MDASLDSHIFLKPVKLKYNWIKFPFSRTYLVDLGKYNLLELNISSLSLNISQQTSHQQWEIVSFWASI